MRTLPNPICPAAFVGVRVPVDPERGLNSAFHVLDGTMTIQEADGTTREVWAQVLPPPPYAITEDTTILGGIFRQETPHTVLFNVTPGVRLVIQGDGQYVNCSLPDEAEIVGFPNLSHGVEVETGNPERPTVRLLCECEACCCAQSELAELRGKSLAEEIALGTRDAEGRRIHSAGGLKTRFRERRKVGAKVTQDRSRQASENLAALQKHKPGATITAGLRTLLKRGV